MNRTLLGLLLLILVAGIAAAVSMLDLNGLTRGLTPPEPVTVSIFYGGEKSGLLENPKVREIIEDRHGVTLDATKAGSIEMVTSLDTSGKDCLWPSNMVAVEFAREAGKTVLAEDTIFNSPIVLYAWSEVADALVRAGAAHQRPDGFLGADLRAIADLIAAKTRWKEDLGLNIYGPFKVFSTDPAKSNSGNIWAALLATEFNGGVTPTEADLPKVLPRLADYFATMGFMETSSGDIFEAFLKQGMGARPIIVGYENQLVEFLQSNAQYADTIRDRIRVIYPEPTIFASHPLISLTPKCKRLGEALSDPDLQSLAWAEHGFRTGLIGVQNDPAAMTVTQLPETIDLVAPMPSAPVMARISAAVQ